MLLFHIQDHDLNPGKEEILAFVNDNFFEEGNELEEWIPEDWIEEPAFLERIVDPGIWFCERNWYQDCIMCSIWKTFFD